MTSNIQFNSITTHLPSMLNEHNCLEFSSHETIQLITRIIIFKRGTLNDKLNNILVDPRFQNYEQQTLINIFKNIIHILDCRKLKQYLNPDELKFIYHIGLNVINENGRINKNEIFKIVRTKLFLDTNKFDSKIFEILDSVKERVIILDKYSIPTYLLPKKTGMYLVERSNNYILALGHKYLNVNSHIVFYNRRKVFGIGFVHSIYKEGIINNTYRILPILVITNDNVVHTDDLEECEYPVRNVPFCVITHEESELFINNLTEVSDKLSLGARLVGDQILKKSSKSILWYNLSYDTLLDMFEKRLILHGTPSSGKSILGVQLLRYLANKGRKIICIAPHNPNLSKFGMPLKSIGISNPKWDLENFSSQYLSKYGKNELKEYSQIILGENHMMPDINNLSKKTIISLINEVTGSVQIKNLIALEMVEKTIFEVLEMTMDESIKSLEDFQQNQIKALKRVATILIKWQNIGKKINLKEELFSNTGSMGFYINSELFLPELAYILLAEIFYNSKPCFDIKNDGYFVMIDEIPLLMNSEGVLVDGQNIGKIFTQINKQGRNMGILLGSIIQDYTSKIQNYFLQQTLSDYATLHLMVRNGKRVLKINNDFILIPPITNI